jgi:hypothetical protein
MDFVPYRLKINAGTVTGNVEIRAADTIYETGSTVTFTQPVVDQGSYVSIRSATARTDDGTDCKSATVTGTCAFFIDYVREYDSNHEYNF